MEQDIKNFDRNIEQMMNEQQVAPPFGMWNRIAAELETVPVAATTAPTAVIPKRAVVGIIVAALMIGATVTGYMVNSFVNKNNAPSVNNVSETVKNAVQTPAVNIEKSFVPQPEKSQLVAAIVRKHKTTPVAIKMNDETKGAEETTVAAVVTQQLPVNGNTDVPTPIQPIAANLNGENPTYYFPPVDMNIPEKVSKEKTFHVAAKQADDDDSDKKTVSEKKIKFHPHKHSKFSYGSIIRNK